MLANARSVGVWFFAAAMMIGSAAADDRIGNCEVTGPAGSHSIQPAHPGRLTVQVHLPAPAWWNGDVAHHISDGFEYCLAANIAHRVGLAQRLLRQRIGGAAAGQDQREDGFRTQFGSEKSNFRPGLHCAPAG